uniref:NERD domain-containing protein n=1 Tax=Oryza glumipatula TaxID=40148 RepID=A0A0E0BE65_9ORYZ
MWVEILCGLLAYKIIRRVFFADSDDPAHLADLDSAHSDLCFALASRLEKLYSARCFVGLRIPDPDAGERQHVDLVLLTNREVMVVAIHNISGFVEVDKDGNWTCPSDKKNKHGVIPNPVLQVNRLAANLQSYLEKRGAKLPDGHITGKIVLPNPNCRPSYAITLQPEVILYDQWKDLKADSKGGLSTWIKGAFSGSKGDMQDSLLQNLHSILSTSPMWDRLEIKGDRNILGEFIEFKGRHDDIQALKCLKRSKVCRFIVQKSTLFGGFGRSRVQILYSPRDYRAEGTSSSEWKEISVKQYTEILFQPLHSKKVKKFKLSSVASVTLSAYLAMYNMYI